MKTYTAKSSAKRAAINELSKERGIDKAEIKANPDAYFQIRESSDGEWYYHPHQDPDVGATLKPEKTADQLGSRVFGEATEEEQKKLEEKADQDLEEQKAKEVLDEQKADEEEIEKIRKRTENTTLDGQVRASSVKNPCKMVWDIAESMPGARRKDIIQACVDAGVATNTARTQYQRYTEACKAQKGE